MPEGTLYRVTVFFKRKPGLTHEQFSHHWKTVHGPLVAPWVQKHRITQYTQFHTPAELRKAFSGDLPSGNASLDYDGSVDWYVSSIEQYENSYKDAYYINVIEPDEHNFVDKGDGGKTIVGAAITAGFSKDIVAGGKILVEQPELTEDQKKWLSS